MTPVESISDDKVTLYLRAANFLAAAQIYLRDNCLLEEPLDSAHIKPRLLGHWGTCPGINLIYASLNRLILESGADILLVTGPGHGAPANLANLWLEGSLEEIDPALSRNRAGLFNLVKRFSWPDGFPSHLSPVVPGVIHEGGELGYALATAFGAALDNPDLIVACIVGDGEAETGPTATGWHSSKFLNPANDGAVLPMLHLNEYKISSRTIFGSMGDEELMKLFEGYGWRPRVVEGADLVEAMWQALAWAYGGIKSLQEMSRSGRRPDRPTWPMLIVRSPKGWTGIRELDGTPIEGTFRSHQVPAKDARDNPVHLAALEAWLRSYRPEELFDERGSPAADIEALIPSGERRMGMNPHANGGRLRVPLRVPALERHAVEVKSPGEDQVSALRTAGPYLTEVFQLNRAQRNFRLVCPDELASNLLDDVLSATSRVFQWPLTSVDVGIGPEGRVMEVLSEHNCQGWLQGYLLTGRHGLFPCYEAFAEIVTSMAHQYAKFLKVMREVSWREPVPSLNYLLTSEGWRQEHNGYSHQGPGFITTLLNLKGSVARIYLPADANCLLASLEHVLSSTGYINLVVCTKQPLPQWLTLEEAREHCAAGASVWEWAGSEDGGTPDVVLVAAGTIPTIEVIAAAGMLRRDAPELGVRVVNVYDLLTLEDSKDHPHGMDGDEFERIYTLDRPIVFFFHGYPSAVHQLVYHRPNPERFHVKGYREEGTTTTPYDLLVANGASRHQIAIEALRRAAGWSTKAAPLVEKYERELTAHRRFIVEHGIDPPEIGDWTLAARS